MCGIIYRNGVVRCVLSRFNIYLLIQWLVLITEISLNASLLLFCFLASINAELLLSWG